MVRNDLVRNESFEVFRSLTLVCQTWFHQPGVFLVSNPSDQPLGLRSLERPV